MHQLKSLVFPMVRHALTLGAGAFGMEAYASSDEMGALIGGVMAGIAILWSVVEKKTGAKAG